MGSSSQSSLKDQDQKGSESGDTELVSSEIDSNDELEPPSTLVRQNAMSAEELQALLCEDSAPDDRNQNFPQDPQ